MAKILRAVPGTRNVRTGIAHFREGDQPFIAYTFTDTSNKIRDVRFEIYDMDEQFYYYSLGQADALLDGSPITDAIADRWEIECHARGLSIT